MNLVKKISSYLEGCILLIVKELIFKALTISWFVLPHSERTERSKAMRSVTSLLELFLFVEIIE